MSITRDQLRARPILNYHGGKFLMRKWIMSHFSEHDIYIEPFGGSASILLYKEPCRLEIYNDLDSRIVNVFNMAKFHGAELLRQLKTTPFSREIYLASINNTRDPIEMAVNTICRSYMGIGDSIYNASGFRNSKTSNSSPAQSFKNYVDFFDFFIERLRGVIIESLDYKEIINKYDTTKSLFYFDPPYVHSTRTRGKSYAHELSDDDHRAFLEQVKQIQGMAIVSGYDCPLYSELDWAKFTRSCSTQKNNKNETIWMNY